MRSADFQKTGDSLLAESGERQQAEEALSRKRAAVAGYLG
jgi:hypothetical protein